MLNGVDVILPHLQLAVLYYLWHSDRKYLQNSLKVQQKKINLLKTKMLCRTRLCWMR